MRVFAVLTIFLGSAVLYSECAIQWSTATKICVKPYGKNPGHYEVPSSGILKAVKLTHVDGHVQCKKEANTKTKWGCNAREHNRQLVEYINIHVTGPKDIDLFPTPDPLDGGYYKVAGKNANSDTLILGDVLGVDHIAVQAGDIIKFWYGEDLHSSGKFNTKDNSGMTCFNVQAYIA